MTNPMEECQSILNYIMNQPDSGKYLESLFLIIIDPFQSPVPWREWGLDDYPRIIKQPMDLGTISVLTNYYIIY